VKRKQHKILILILILVTVLTFIPNEISKVSAESDTSPPTGQRIYFPLDKIKMQSLQKFKIECSMRNIDNTNVKYNYKIKDKNLATVSNDGLITAIKDGTTTIEVTSPKYGGKGILTVQISTQNSILVNNDNIILEKNERKKINASVKHYKKDGNITYKSMDTNIATVDKYGLVISKNYGTTIIRAYYNLDNLYKDIIVQVREPSYFVKNVLIRLKNLNGDKLGKRHIYIDSIDSNFTTNLNGEFKIPKIPIDEFNMYLYNVENSKLDATLTVKFTTDIIGIDLVVSKPNLQITNVIRQKINEQFPVKGITSNIDNIDINIGQEHKIDYIITPENASNKNVRFISEDTGIATVNGDGIIVGKTKGKTKIQVIAIDGEMSFKIDVTVSSGNSKKYSLAIIIVQISLLAIIIAFVGTRYAKYMRDEKKRADELD